MTASKRVHDILIGNRANAKIQCCLDEGQPAGEARINLTTDLQLHLT